MNKLRSRLSFLYKFHSLILDHNTAAIIILKLIPVCCNVLFVEPTGTQCFKAVLDELIVWGNDYRVQLIHFSKLVRKLTYWHAITDNSKLKCQLDFWEIDNIATRLY